MLPLTDVWTGALYNPCPLYPKDSPPLFYAAPRGTTPFRFNVHVGDVGHTLNTGAYRGRQIGFMSILPISFAYEGAQFIFSIRAIASMF